MAFTGPKKKGVIADINVTPLVDVMLVLLVIFMISAPLMFSGINLKLPKTKKVNNLKLNNQQVILSLTPTGDYFLGNEKFLHTEIVDVVKKKLNESGTDIVYIRADYSLTYGNVAKTMALLKSAGILNLALVTESEK